MLFQFIFLPYSDGQLLSQGDFDKFSKTEAIVYAVDKFRKGSIQRNFEKKEGLSLILESSLFSNGEKQLFNEVYELGKQEKSDSVDLNNIRQL